MFTTRNREAVERAAEKAGIDPRSMIALGLTEANGAVTWRVGVQELPPIRPEVHVFYRELSAFPQLQERAMREGLAHPRPNGVSLPRSYAARYAFYERMQRIHTEAAAASTSFGWGQVMGFNYKMLGLSSPVDVDMMAQTVEGQTELVSRYLDKTGLIPFMNDLPRQASAERIARGYNGPAWRKNNYANKLISNWKRATGDGVAEGRDISTLQTTLSRLGYDPGRIDGRDGPATRAAVRRYQEDNGLVVDGDAGEMTWKSLSEDLTQLDAEKKQKNKDRVGSVGVGVGGIAVISELLGEFEGLKTTITDFLSNFTIPEGTVEIALMLALAYIVYNRFFRK